MRPGQIAELYKLSRWDLDDKRRTQQNGFRTQNDCRLLDLRVGNQAKDLPAQLCNSYAYLAIAELRSLKLTFSAYTDD